MLAKNERIVRYTAAEIDEMIRRGEDMTDWARVDAMTEEELEAAIDPEDEGEVDHSTVWLGIPKNDQNIYVPIDQDVAEWFTSTGPGWPARITAVLRRYVEAQQTDAAPAPARPAEPATGR